MTTAGENGLSISARRLKLLCALHESGSGTFRTSQTVAAMSVADGKADEGRVLFGIAVTNYGECI
jgi:hypothetical protein